MPVLLISIRFHDGRYHGRAQGGPDWPPSPARLFQALVAGAARGAALDGTDQEALSWLENLEAPIIAAPVAREGCGYTNFVPNNDLDAVGGDLRRAGKIRAAKTIRPMLFNASAQFLYAWRFEGNDEAAQRICAIAEQLYQLGRGVDMAWATGEIIGEETIEDRLATHEGAIYRPAGGGDGLILAVPLKGSLQSLIARHEGARARFERTGSNRREQTLFRQPPKPRFRQIIYDSPPRRLLFDLSGAKAPWRLDRIAALTEAIRDGAAKRLTDALPDQKDMIERILIGRDATEADKAQRIRITPLPSIGHTHADRAIRRVLVELPPDCPQARDFEWSFSGLEILPSNIDSETGEIAEQLILAAAQDLSMLHHYGVREGEPARFWRTVTPAALPVSRRRIAPARQHAEAKKGGERADEESKAISAVLTALRHAGVDTTAVTIRVRREPFAAKGARAETFAHDRFGKHRLWHVEIIFQTPRAGPLIIGDGRYLGLGLMAPTREGSGVLAFQIAGSSPAGAHTHKLTRALRRAVMARVQETIGEGKPLPAFFTGHEESGSVARSGEHSHLAFAYDAARSRLLVLAPHVIERREMRRGEAQYLRTLESALNGLEILRAGVLGVLHLSRTYIYIETDPLFAPARAWTSATPYRVTRHRKTHDAYAALAADIRDECIRLRLPHLEIDPSETRGVPDLGLVGRARLSSQTALAGPILIGRDRHFGGGLFVPNAPVPATA